MSKKPSYIEVVADDRAALLVDLLMPVHRLVTQQRSAMGSCGGGGCLERLHGFRRGSLFHVEQSRVAYAVV